MRQSYALRLISRVRSAPGDRMRSVTTGLGWLSVWRMKKGFTAPRCRRKAMSGQKLRGSEFSPAHRQLCRVKIPHVALCVAGGASVGWSLCVIAVMAWFLPLVKTDDTDL